MFGSPNQPALADLPLSTRERSPEYRALGMNKRPVSTLALRHRWRGLSAAECWRMWWVRRGRFLGFAGLRRGGVGCECRFLGGVRWGGLGRGGRLGLWTWLMGGVWES